MQFVCGPVIGGLSDRFGRKPVLLLSLALLSADDLILVLAARLPTGAASSTQVMRRE